MVEPRPGPSRRGEHARGEAAGRAFRRRPLQRRLETLRTACGIHQSEARAAVAIRDAAIRAFAISDRCVYSRAVEFLAGITKNDESEAVREKEIRPQRRQGRERAGVKPLKEFHSDPIYAGDLYRADMAWAKHAAGCGLTLEQITDELLAGRDLSKKGNRKRQVEYVIRTAEKAPRGF